MCDRMGLQWQEMEGDVAYKYRFLRCRGLLGSVYSNWGFDVVTWWRQRRARGNGWRHMRRVRCHRIQNAMRSRVPGARWAGFGTWDMLVEEIQSVRYMINEKKAAIPCMLASFPFLSFSAPTCAWDRLRIMKICSHGHIFIALG